MKQCVMGVLVLTCSLAYADAAPEQRPRPSRGFWDVLVQAGKRWVLKDEDKKNVRLIVETYDVRKVGAASVARLRWTLVDGKTKTDVGAPESGRFTQLAVTPQGLYVLSADMDDAKIAEALKKKPSRSDPPKAYSGSKQNDGRYLKLEDNDTACMGFEPLPGAGDCPDLCEGEVCYSRTSGVVRVSGRWSPTELPMAQ